MTLRDHIVKPCHFMDKETEIQFLRNLPPVIQLVRKTARARTPESWYPVQCFFCYIMMPLTGYLTIIQEIFVEGLLSVRHYPGLWGYSHEQSPASWIYILVWETDNEQIDKYWIRYWLVLWRKEKGKGIMIFNHFISLKSIFSENWWLYFYLLIFSPAT